MLFGKRNSTIVRVKTPEEIPSLLEDPTIDYVVLDDRKTYRHGGDKTIQNNIRIIRRLCHKQLGERMYKLVFLPEEKVYDDLMYGASFTPEPWLFKMLNYYDEVHWTISRHVICPKEMRDQHRLLLLTCRHLNVNFVLYLQVTEMLSK